MDKAKKEIEEEVVKSFAKQSCMKLFDVLLEFLQYLFSGRRLKILVTLTIVFWVITIVNIVLGGKLTDFGIQPRDFPFGFLGIFIAPFIHNSISHVFANTLPFICLGALVMLRGMKVWIMMSITVALSSGFLVWMIGRSNTKHVGSFRGHLFIPWVFVQCSIYRTALEVGSYCYSRRCLVRWNAIWYFSWG